MTLPYSSFPLSAREWAAQSHALERFPTPRLLRLGFQASDVQPIPSDTEPPVSPEEEEMLWS